MAKTQEDFQQELAQLFVRAGETQFMVKAYKDAITSEHDKLNNLNQKIETLQKAFRTYLSTKAAVIPTEAPKEVADVQPDQAV